MSGWKSVEHRYDLFDTPEECAKVAAQRFIDQHWRWKRIKGAPSEPQILESLQSLAKSGSGHIEGGRLIYLNGRYGVQNLARPEF